MKKILSFVLAASICISVFAADVFNFAPMQGNVKNYTKTEFSIASKFGNYFRTPSVKFTHVYDSNGREIESTELTAKDVEVNTIKSSYDSLGNLKKQVCTTTDGEILWKSEFTYKNGVKSEISEYNGKNELMGKTIFTYSFDKLIDESSYDGEGALVWKIVYTYDDDKLDAISQYSPNGALSEKASYDYSENGKINSISHFDSITKAVMEEVFRYNDNGTLNEITTYAEDKQITKRVLFKYDTKGNVNKVSTYNVAQKFGTIVNELAAQSEYAYTYGQSEDVTIIPDL